jgi:hypothetical protein
MSVTGILIIIFKNKNNKIDSLHKINIALILTKNMQILVFCLNLCFLYDSSETIKCSLKLLIEKLLSHA